MILAWHIPVSWSMSTLYSPLHTTQQLQLCSDFSCLSPQYPPPDCQAGVPLAPGKWRDAPSEHDVEEHPSTPQVRGRAGLVTPTHLWRHEVQSAHHSLQWHCLSWCAGLSWGSKIYQPACKIISNIIWYSKALLLPNMTLIWQHDIVVADVQMYHALGVDIVKSLQQLLEYAPADLF